MGECISDSEGVGSGGVNIVGIGVATGGDTGSDIGMGWNIGVG